MTMALKSTDTVAARPQAPREATGLSVLICTRNEEVNLPTCLASLDWCDDIVVLDSFSTDRTVEIAKAAGARVYQQVYKSEDQHRMHALTEISFKHSWVYMPDADEITPDDLRDEMLAVAADPSRPEALFKVRYKNMFMGKWIRHSSLYPTWVTRLLRPDRVRIQRKIHAVCESDSPTGYLQSHFIHHSFNKGLAAWFDKHNSYSSVEANLAAERRNAPLNWRDLASRRGDVRRRGLKAISYRLPFRPTFRFAYMYIIRRGFLDGWAGFTYCRLIAGYEFMIVLKTAELQRRRKGLPI